MAAAAEGAHLQSEAEEAGAEEVHHPWAVAVAAEEEAEVVVSAAGGLVTPRFPDEVEGFKEGTFCGPAFHSAEWRHDVEVKGKRVGVIGNACSA